MRLLAMPAIIFLTGASVHAPTAVVETTSWEFTAGQSLLAPDQAQVCSEAFEYLKAHKFEGDFKRFLAWWHDNRHRELSRRRAPTAPPGAD